MKSIDEIRRNENLIIKESAADGGWGTAYLTVNGLINIRKPVMIVFSWGGGWDHVSVSYKDRCCTWEEMCEVKNMFFRPEECVLQYHPPASDYVNTHPFCLHLWRPQWISMPMPPSGMVG